MTATGTLEVSASSYTECNLVDHEGDDLAGGLWASQNDVVVLKSRFNVPARSAKTFYLRCETGAGGAYLYNARLNVLFTPAL